MSVIIELSDQKELIFKPSIREQSTMLAGVAPGAKIKLAAITDLSIWFIFEYHHLPIPKSVTVIDKTTFVDQFGEPFGTLLNKYCYQPNFNEEHHKEFSNMFERNKATLIRLKQFHRDAEYLGMTHLTDLLVAAISLIVMRAPSPEKLQQLIQ